MQRSGRLGFTLIELSIVLVIIGLIVGGVLEGKSLIAQARLNHVMTDMQKFDTAVNAFQGKYDALPGDYTRATQTWGAAGGNASDNYTTSCYGTASLTATCNGNGSNMIECCSESYLFWQQLALAGLIPGSYTGVSYSSVGQGSVLCVIGQNCPSGPNNGGYELYSQPWTVAQAASNIFEYPPMSAIHAYLFGTQPYPSGTTAVWTAYPVFTAAEVFSLDRKYDDGVPLTGNMMLIPAYATSCITPPYNTLTAANYATATYNIAQPGVICSILRVAGF